MSNTLLFSKTTLGHLYNFIFKLLMSALKIVILNTFCDFQTNQQNIKTKILANYGRDRNTHAFSPSLPSAREFCFFCFFWFFLKSPKVFKIAKISVPTLINWRLNKKGVQGYQLWPICLPWSQFWDALPRWYDLLEIGEISTFLPRPKFSDLTKHVSRAINNHQYVCLGARFARFGSFGESLRNAYGNA